MSIVYFNETARHQTKENIKHTTCIRKLRKSRSKHNGRLTTDTTLKKNRKECELD